MIPAAAFFNSNITKLVTEGPALITGITVDATDATGKITLYDGMDPNSGRKFADFTSPTTGAYHHGFTVPVFFNSGIYVEVTSTIHDYTIEYIPLRHGIPAAIHRDFMFDTPDHEGL